VGSGCRAARSEPAGLRVRHLDFLRHTLTVSETIAEVNGRTFAT
jgi:hypothetical protein